MVSNSEYHVASYIVHARDGDAAARAAIAALPGVEVHAEEQNRLIVTAEASHVGELAVLLDTMQSLTGVVNVSPVYHELLDENESDKDSKATAGAPAADGGENS